LKIVFVCLGNICRSPTAHGVMEKLVADAGLADRVTIDSAGTGAYHIGELPDSRSRAHAAKRGYELAHRARQFTRGDVAAFDLIVAMDRNNLRHLRLIAGEAHGKVVLLRSFDATAPADAEVPDPWYGEADGFEEVLDQCERACAGLLAHVRERLRC
jgi:protein-tyrosine phosphatase